MTHTRAMKKWPSAAPDARARSFEHSTRDRDGSVEGDFGFGSGDDIERERLEVGRSRARGALEEGGRDETAATRDETAAEARRDDAKRKNVRIHHSRAVGE